MEIIVSWVDHIKTLVASNEFGESGKSYWSLFLSSMDCYISRTPGVGLSYDQSAIRMFYDTRNWCSLANITLCGPYPDKNGHLYEKMDVCIMLLDLSYKGNLFFPDYLTTTCQLLFADNVVLGEQATPEMKDLMKKLDLDDQKATTLRTYTKSHYKLTRGNATVVAKLRCKKEKGKKRDYSGLFFAITRRDIPKLSEDSYVAITEKTGIRPTVTATTKADWELSFNSDMISLNQKGTDLEYPKSEGINVVDKKMGPEHFEITLSQQVWVVTAL